MKIDMHCHTKYGSLDAKVPISDYVILLKEKGYDGMLVTDHNSYRGYNRWKDEGNTPEGFIVLRGVEYDTRDAGHFIVIMPDGVHLKALKMRGLRVSRLVRLVHDNGGILGPAHPFGSRSSSAMLFNAMKYNRKLIYDFDFIEGFNTCESAESNRLAMLLAEDYNKPVFGGSDSHDYEYVGMGYTDFADEITCNNDIIRAVRDGSRIECGGEVRGFTQKSMHAHAFYSVYSFLAFNKGLGYIFTPVRSRRVKKATKHKRLAKSISD
jgi:predicted metal-dependent phosphoesterase TrpH